MEVFRLEKKRFNLFFKKLNLDFEIYAPVKKELIRFERVHDPSLIYLKQNTYFPLKEFFFKKNEVLFSYKANKLEVPKIDAPKRVFFGVRRCDLNAVMHQDKVFDSIADPYYSASRKNSYLIGYHCNEAPSKYCFCGTLDLKDFYDLMFYDRGSDYLVEIGSKKGEELLKKYKGYFKKTTINIPAEEKVIKGAGRLDKKDISSYYNHPDWKKGVDNCLSCGACTALCPTCYCFDISDKVKITEKNEGDRVRSWSSCQVLSFSEVSGGHVFREKREERFKHRIYHQLDYFKKKNGINLCVGCGRCIEGCPTRIDFVEILNEMK